MTKSIQMNTTKYIRTFFVFFLLSGISHFVIAQKSIKDSSIHLGLLQVRYLGAIPGENMADRFGYLSSIGIEGGYKLRNNFYVMGGLHIIFGEQVKEQNILSNIGNAIGLVAADDGTLSDVALQARGILVPVSVGKILPVIPNYNKNAGLYIEIGTQFIQHRVHFRVQGESVAAISGDYRKGYDRLTNGIGIREGIGFRFFDNQGYVNFSIGVELSQNFTQNRRSINIDTGMQDLTKRMDLLSGFHATWVFPIYKRAPNKIYYN